MSLWNMFGVCWVAVAGSFSAFRRVQTPSVINESAIKQRNAGRAHVRCTRCKRGEITPLFSTPLQVFLFFLRAINLARSLGVRAWPKGMIILTWNAGFSEARIDSEDYCILRHFRKNYKSVILVRKESQSKTKLLHRQYLRGDFSIILTSQESSVFGPRRWKSLIQTADVRKNNQLHHGFF